MKDHKKERQREGDNKKRLGDTRKKRETGMEGENKQEGEETRKRDWRTLEGRERLEKGLEVRETRRERERTWNARRE